MQCFLEYNKTMLVIVKIGKHEQETLKKDNNIEYNDEMLPMG